MSAVVDGPGAVAEVLPPSADRDYAAAAIMVTRAEKGMEIVFAAVLGRVPEGVLQRRLPFQQWPAREMKSLPVAILRAIDPVKQCRHSRDDGQPSQQVQFNRQKDGFYREISSNLLLMLSGSLSYECPNTQ